MAGYNKYDPRLESLVMETLTLWDAEVGDVSEQDKRWLARAIHEEPQKASNVKYERSHTGFRREVTVTVADIERLYQERYTG